MKGNRNLILYMKACINNEINLNKKLIDLIIKNK